MDALMLAVEEFSKLKRQHPYEGTDFANGIHTCQCVLVLRNARRDFQEGWPIKE